MLISKEKPKNGPVYHATLSESMQCANGVPIRGAAVTGPAATQGEERLRRSWTREKGARLHTGWRTGLHAGLHTGPIGNIYIYIGSIPGKSQPTKSGYITSDTTSILNADWKRSIGYSQYIKCI